MLNNDAPSETTWPGSMTAGRRVLDHQIKLHRWARNEPDRRFDDVFNLICDRATLVVAWERVSGNRGARTAGVDAVTRFHIEERHGVIPFLEELRSSLKDGSFTALPVKQAVIPKKNGKVRYLGIPTLRDRVAQMALKLVLEPIFEADFYPSSYGYRPGRRAQDAIAEIHRFTRKPSTYDWVIEGDIKACFDNVDHHVLMDLVAERVKDRKVLRLVSAFLRAGVVELHGGFAETLTGTPQGGVASPLLANVKLMVRHGGAAAAADASGTPSGSTTPPASANAPSHARAPRPDTALTRHAADFRPLPMTEPPSLHSVPPTPEPMMTTLCCSVAGALRLGQAHPAVVAAAAAPPATARNPRRFTVFDMAAVCERCGTGYR